MATLFSRYAQTPRLNFGEQQGTSTAIQTIRNAIKNGSIAYRTVVARGAQRLDVMAGETYGDARFWWVLAAASDIGWGLQIPAGTVINIPELADIARIVG